MAPLDALASNAFSAHAPNPLNLGHAVKHLLDSTTASPLRNVQKLFNAKRTLPFDGVCPPGNVPRVKVGALPQLAQAKPATMRSRETWRDLPQLPPSEIDNVRRYCDLNRLAAGPSVTRRDNAAPDRPAVQDAFQSTVSDTNSNQRHILPAGVRNSKLVNASLYRFPGVGQTFEEDDAGIPQPGQTRDGLMTHLWDKKTGFSAGITYDPDRREMVIAFPGLDATGGKSWAQRLRCAFNWLGTMPKNMSQASKLTKLVKAHVDELNQQLPADQQIKLTLTGHSMGGGLASYAALRNSVPAVVINPMRLGWLARARIGQTQLLNADKYLTEVVTQGDWVSDNDASKLYAPLVPVFNIRGPLGHARRFMLPSFGENKDVRHNGTRRLLEMMELQQQVLHSRAPTVLPHLQQTSPKARGEMNGGRVERAVDEAVKSGSKAANIKLRKGQSGKIARLVQTLISGKDGSTKVPDNEIAGKRTELQQILNDVRNSNGQRLPQVLQDIERDFVTNIPRAARLAFSSTDPHAVRRFQSLYNSYKPGGARFHEIIDRFDLDDEDIDADALKRILRVNLVSAFGAQGDYLDRDDGANRRVADKALMGAISTMLNRQRLGMLDDDNDAARLDELVTKANAWAANGVPENQRDNVQEEAPLQT